MFGDTIRTLAFDDKNSARALHLADFLAFHARRHHSLASAHPKLIVPEGQILKRLRTKVPHTLRFTDVRNLEKAPDYEKGDATWMPVPLSLRPRP
jgi:hypothetical protein